MAGGCWGRDCEEQRAMRDFIHQYTGVKLLLNKTRESDIRVKTDQRSGGELTSDLLSLPFLDQKGPLNLLPKLLPTTSCSSLYVLSPPEPLWLVLGSSKLAHPLIQGKLHRQSWEWQSVIKISHSTGGRQASSQLGVRRHPGTH